MKLKKLIASIALLTAFALTTSPGQSMITADSTTNPPATFASSGISLPSSLSPTISGGLQQVMNAALASTNFAVAVGGGRSVKANHDLLFADYLYNFVSSGSTKAGFLLGFDEIADNMKFSSKNINFVKGGLSVQTTITPLANWGFTNFMISPFASVLIDSGNGQVGQIVVAGGNYTIAIKSGWAFNLMGFYENRTGGDTTTDGAYVCAAIAISKGF